MNTFKHIGLVAGFFLTVLLTLSSCGDFLEEYSQDQYYPSNYEDLDELLVGDAYIQRSSSTGNFIHFLADEMEEQNTSYNGSSDISPSSLRGSMFGLYTWQVRSGQNEDFTGFNAENDTWTDIYRHINIASNIIATAEKMEGKNNEEKDGIMRVLGEAYFLRAACYFYLVNLYGKPYVATTASSDPGVPVKIEEKVNDIKYQRNTVQETYDQIILDLQDAEQLLSQTGTPKTIYHADIYAVYLLRSRVALYMQQWQIAADYADKVLAGKGNLINLNNSAPHSDFLSKTSTETIFSMGGYAATGQQRYMLGHYRVANELYNSYDDTDLRKSQWYWKMNSFIGITKIAPVIGTSEIAPTETNYYNSQYYGGAGGEATVSDRFLFRSAEAYLIKAEASAYLGNEQEARNRLNTLRRNRYAEGSDYTVSATGKALVDSIRLERYREFAFEGHRWFDLRRYGVCEKYPESKRISHRYTVFNVISYRYVAAEAHVYTLEPNDAHYTLPIPQEVLDFNTGMVNNERHDINYIIDEVKD